MGINVKANQMFRSFNKLFWTVNTLELFERGAFYGIMAFFSFHLVDNLNIPEENVGMLSALLFALLYFVPIIASAIARKIGYKTVLIFAFSILIPSYFFMTFVRSELGFFFLIIAWGIGAGSFKPMVSATIAHVTEREHRNLAYSIYYWLINLGAFLTPLVLALLIPENLAQIAFIVGSVLITINLLITIFFYKNPAPPKPDEKILSAFIDMAKVLSDKKFTILLLIYSGFFMIFSVLHTFLPLYGKFFGIWPWNVALLATLNPATIIIFGPALSKVADKFDSLKLMVTGMFIFCIGLLLLGFIPVLPALIIGILIFSTGEFLTHPNFISYVSKIAPKDKVALYMGYAFLPSAVGLVLGSLVGGQLYSRVARDMELPRLFWAIYIAIGLFTISNFLIFNKYFGKKKEEKKKSRNFWNSKLTIVGIYVLIGIVIFSGTRFGTTPYLGSGDDDGKPPEPSPTEIVQTMSLSGYSAQNDGYDEVFFIEGDPVWVNVSLTWTDENVRAPLNNNPDTFYLQLIDPYGSSESTPQSSNGNIADSFDIQAEDWDLSRDGGNWTVNVYCSDAGDIYGPLNIIQRSADDGNDWDLTIRVTYLDIVEQEENGI